MFKKVFRFRPPGSVSTSGTRCINAGRIPDDFNLRDSGLTHA